MPVEWSFFLGMYKSSSQTQKSVLGGLCDVIRGTKILCSLTQLEEALSIYIRGIVAVLVVCLNFSQVVSLIGESPALEYAVKDFAAFLFRCIDRVCWWGFLLEEGIS